MCICKSCGAVIDCQETTCLECGLELDPKDRNCCELSDLYFKTQKEHEKKEKEEHSATA